jgi:excisionase family DNA binding protein
MSSLISISELQQVLKISRSTANRLLNSGELRRVHIGRAVRIPSEDVEAFMQRLRSVG